MRVRPTWRHGGTFACICTKQETRHAWFTNNLFFFSCTINSLFIKMFLSLLRNSMGIFFYNEHSTLGWRSCYIHGLGVGYWKSTGCVVRSFPFVLFNCSNRGRQIEEMFSSIRCWFDGVECVCTNCVVRLHERNRQIHFKNKEKLRFQSRLPSATTPNVTVVPNCYSDKPFRWRQRRGQFRDPASDSVVT